MSDFATRYLGALDLDTIFGSEHARPPAWHKFRLFFGKLADDINAMAGTAPMVVEMNDTGMTLVVNNASGATQTDITSNVWLVDAESAGSSEILTIPIATTLPEGVYTLLNTGDEGIDVTVSGGASLGIVSANGIMLIVNNGTTIRAKHVATGNAAGTNVVADPGNAGAIAVTKSGSCALTSAGAETRTLAIPSFKGQRLALYADTYVGDIVITASQQLNQAGNTIMTFGAARDNLELVAITVGGALRWQIGSNNGVSLS